VIRSVTFLSDVECVEVCCDISRRMQRGLYPFPPGTGLSGTSFQSFWTGPRFTVKFTRGPVVMQPPPPRLGKLTEFSGEFVVLEGEPLPLRLESELSKIGDVRGEVAYFGQFQY